MNKIPKKPKCKDKESTCWNLNFSDIGNQCKGECVLNFKPYTSKKQKPMEEQFLPDDLSLILKQKGFDEPCFGYWHLYKDNMTFSFWNWVVFRDYPSHTINSELENGVAAPLWQQVIDWFRVNHKIMIRFNYYKDNEYFYEYLISEPKTASKCDIFAKSHFKTFEESRLDAIKEALTLI